MPKYDYSFAEVWWFGMTFEYCDVLENNVTKRQQGFAGQKTGFCRWIFHANKGKEEKKKTHVQFNSQTAGVYKYILNYVWCQVTGNKTAKLWTWFAVQLTSVRRFVANLFTTNTMLILTSLQVSFTPYCVENLIMKSLTMFLQYQVAILMF